MSNHLHCIWQAKEGYKLSDIIRDFKKFTSKRITSMIEQGTESRKVWLLKKFEFAGKRLQRIKKYKFWKDDNHAIFLGDLDTRLLEQKLDYIHNNPVNAMIVKEPYEYIFSSAIDYCDGKGLVRIVKVQ